MRIAKQVCGVKVVEDVPQAIEHATSQALLVRFKGLAEADLHTPFALRLIKRLVAGWLRKS